MIPVILAPSYGDNYDLGYIGFTSPVTQQDVISVGIAYFEGYDRLIDIAVTHVFIVTGENTCIEALMGKGVVEDPLQPYFDDPKTHIFFRKPADYTKEIGHRISEYRTLSRTSYLPCSTLPFSRPPFTMFAPAGILASFGLEDVRPLPSNHI
jgi:hypothetical protein